jgi:3-hydroxy-9,10-secoandrosta-1,3,5(10)-triene-9,17-dione monooxygenase
MTNKVLSAVTDLLPGFRERAAQADRDRRVPAESIAELQEAGVFRMLQPKAFGGFEADPVDFYEVVKTVAGACGSTGWVSSIVGVHPWQLGLFPAEAQQEVWGEDSATLVSSSYAPTGKLTPVDGGYECTGRWSFSSGCDHCSWVLLGAIVMGPEGKPVDFLTILVPRSDYSIDDVWDVVGLRGTGSNDIVIDKKFIPAHRTLSFNDVGALKCPGQELNTSPLYKLPFGTVFSNTITAPIIGIAEGAYKAHIDRMQERVRISYGGQKVSGDGFAHVRVARAPRPRSTPRGSSSSATSARSCASPTPARRSRASCGCGPGATRSAAPSAASRRSRCCSRTPAATRSRAATRSSARGATPTPARSTPPTTPSAGSRCTARASSACRSRTR